MLLWQRIMANGEPQRGQGFARAPCSYATGTQPENRLQNDEPIKATKVFPTSIQTNISSKHHNNYIEYNIW